MTNIDKLRLLLLEASQALFDQDAEVFSVIREETFSARFKLRTQQFTDLELDQATLELYEPEALQEIARQVLKSHSLIMASSDPHLKNLLDDLRTTIRPFAAQVLPSHLSAKYPMMVKNLMLLVLEYESRLGIKREKPGDKTLLN